MHARQEVAARGAVVRFEDLNRRSKGAGQRQAAQVTEEDLFVEGRLKASGLKYTLVRHPPFLDTVVSYIGGNPLVTGVLAPAGAGKKRTIRTPFPI